MALIENPAEEKPRLYRHWRDWTIIALALTLGWCTLCWVVQMMASR